MVSSPIAPRTRRRPEERRAEIIAEAASIALGEGLERITVRAVAERLGVRPGLITHYFPAVEDLVIAAFVQAIAHEREELIPAEGDPMQRMAQLVSRAEGPESRELSRLWLNARHLSRFRPALAEALEEQEAIDRDRLVELIEAAIVAGDVTEGVDPLAACIRILIAVDGVGAYANDPGAFEHDAYGHFVADVAEWALGLRAGALRRGG
ncbi:hypothetical protein GCM10009819_22550 [Agromyces tropicus]|uniref:HTH tetR-type domain-containing protein n=1 Tax=Agromyces tropicus TaxID=555371 RepID=A0ABN2UH26_9MICO